MANRLPISGSGAFSSWSCPVERGPLRADGVDQIIEIELQPARFDHQRFDVFGQQRLPIGARRRPRGGDARADAGQHFQQSLRDQQADDALRRIRIDPQLLTERPHRRKRIAGFSRPDTTALVTA